MLCGSSWRSNVDPQRWFMCECEPRRSCRCEVNVFFYTLVCFHTDNWTQASGFQMCCGSSSSLVQTRAKNSVNLHLFIYWSECFTFYVWMFYERWVVDERQDTNWLLTLYTLYTPLFSPVLSARHEHPRCPACNNTPDNCNTWQTWTWSWLCSIYLFIFRQVAVASNL